MRFYKPCLAKACYCQTVSVIEEAVWQVTALLHLPGSVEGGAEAALPLLLQGFKVYGNDFMVNFMCFLAFLPLN